MQVNPKPSRANCARCWTRPDRRPMREPVFNETLQLGIVVRDLEATMRRYVDDYGIGPWEVYEFDAGKAEDCPRVRSAGRALLAPCCRHGRPGAVGADRADLAARRRARLRAFSRREGRGRPTCRRRHAGLRRDRCEATRANGEILSGEFAGARSRAWERPRSRGGHRDLQRHPGRPPAAGREALTPGTPPRTQL
jgi:hypothetical protein